MNDILLESINTSIYYETTLNNILKEALFKDKKDKKEGKDNGSKNKTGAAKKIFNTLIELIKKAIEQIGNLLGVLNKRGKRLNIINPKIDSWFGRIKNRLKNGKIKEEVEVYPFNKYNSKNLIDAYYKVIQKVLIDCKNLKPEPFEKYQSKIDKRVYGKSRNTVSKEIRTFDLYKDFNTIHSVTSATAIVADMNFTKEIEKILKKYESKIKSSSTQLESAVKSQNMDKALGPTKDALRYRSAVTLLLRFKNNYRSDMDRMIADSLKITTVLKNKADKVLSEKTSKNKDKGGLDPDE